MESYLTGRSAGPAPAGLGARKSTLPRALKVTILFVLLAAVIYPIYDSYQFQHKTLVQMAKINEQINVLDHRDKTSEAYISSLKEELSQAVGLMTSTDRRLDPTFAPSPMVAFLKVNVGSSSLQANKENYIFSNTIYPPGHPNYHSILPSPDPSPGVFWGVLFTPAPYTVRNTTNKPIDVLWNVYSDNVYSYQGRETIPPQSYRTMNFGTMQLGYVYGPNPPGSVGPGNVGVMNPRGFGMPLAIGLSPDADGLTGYWDTQGPTPLYPNFHRVSGATVTLTPLCQLPNCR